MSERKICTKESPYNSKDKDRREKWQHPDAVSVCVWEGYPGGDIETYECPHCGLRFKVELPQ